MTRNLNIPLELFFHSFVVRVMGILLIVAVVVTGWAYWGADATSHKLSFSINDTCDFHLGPCQAIAEGGEKLEFSISPKDIPLLKPLKVLVKLKGFRANSVVVVFTGVDVDMGELTYPLRSSDGVVFEGEASLSVCSSRRMTWQASLFIETEGSQVTVPFNFDTGYRSSFKLI